MNWPEVGAMATGAAFIVGVVKVLRGARDKVEVNPENLVTKEDCKVVSGEIHKDIKEMRAEQTKQGKMLERVDERTQRWAKKNGFEKQ